MDTPNTAELNGSIPETTQVRVPDLERIRNARKRRMIQIKEWQQYDRKMTRETEKQQRKGYGPGGDKNMYKTGPQVKFPQSLIFLEAAARGDLDEGKSIVNGCVKPNGSNCFFRDLKVFYFIRFSTPSKNTFFFCPGLHLASRPSAV
ncbi:Protein phosphatase 1 regulatory inhibitor subunit 16B [Fasciola gigantica]|uniref:Protein phosphatase 1 regulatory inhibitor subunit 16B n=1 Tax=Fasciola gigantica TaxID=46835 RepID=A0A504Z2K6_FASGI|nr:Protein phosphatase 1 regulatory inhibitor subunit 16B [Fasciola gigantica]